jgi:hypothetical protein
MIEETTEATKEETGMTIGSEIGVVKTIEK